MVRTGNNKTNVCKGVKMKKYRIGIDMGVTSIGWALLELNDNNEPVDVMKMGVRIFPDGRDAKTREPLSVTRRNHRAMRRNRDRLLQRKKHLMDCLIQHKLMPDTEEERKQMQTCNPYELRARGVHHEITLNELGRALFHINQRRGFKSNRKLDSTDKEGSRLKAAIKELKQTLEASESLTLGEYLYKLNNNVDPKKQHQRIPLRIRDYGKEYNFYTSRLMYDQEFNLLWDTQAHYHPELTNALKERIFDIIFHQRPLKPQEKGKCQLEPGKPRASFAWPVCQQFRIYQEVNNLVLLDFDRKEQPLTPEQRDIIVDELLTTGKVSFKSLRKKLKLAEGDYAFNLESENRKDLIGDETAAKMRNKKLFGKAWDNFDIVKQTRIVGRILNETQNKEIESTLIPWLIEQGAADEEAAKEISKVRLSAKVSNLSLKAINAILPYIQEGAIYSDACTMAGYNHSSSYTGELFDNGDLPYYGEILQKHVMFADTTNYTPEQPEQYYGRIANVTVHIALNQLRKLINAITRTYGPPTQIVMEVARDLPMNAVKLKEYDNNQKRRTADNNRIAAELELIGVENNYQNRLRYKLWEELNSDKSKRCCPYSGVKIRLNAVDGLYSNRFEIEHILPKSRTFDDSAANKTISLRAANRVKGERSPFEAFGHNPTGYNWNEILTRAEALPHNKCRRFYENAMERFSDENEVLARHLNDTRYMSRIAREYMSYVVGTQVWVTPGMLTSMLRSKWGLNALLSEDGTKNRNDHRHHAIDAFVIGCTHKEMLKKVATAIKYSSDRFIEKLPLPYPAFSYDAMQQMVDGILISYKPDHGNAQRAIQRSQSIGYFHLDTAYSKKPIDGTRSLYSVYKPITFFDSTSKLSNIVNDRIQCELLVLTNGVSGSKFREIVTNYATANNLKRIKIQYNKQNKSMIKVKLKGTSKYKYYESQNNYCADIYIPDRDNPKNKWELEQIRNYDAHQKHFIPNWQQKYPWLKRIMRLQINDIIVFEKKGKLYVNRVELISKQKIFLYPLESNIPSKQKKYWEASATALQKHKARKAGIDILGNLSDPGWRYEDSGTDEE